MFGIKSAREKELEAEIALLKTEKAYYMQAWIEWMQYAEDSHKFFDRKNEDNQLIINDLNRQVMENKKTSSK